MTALTQDHKAKLYDLIFPDIPLPEYMDVIDYLKQEIDKCFSSEALEKKLKEITEQYRKSNPVLANDALKIRFILYREFAGEWRFNVFMDLRKAS